MADLLELATNKPEVVALAYADGREYPSKIPGAPAQVMFTLVDGRRVFWPQPFAESLKSAGIAANVPFEVVKAEIAKGRTQLQFRPLSGGGRAVNAPASEAPTSKGTNNYSSPNDIPAPPERLYTAPATRTAPPAAPEPTPITPRAACMCAAMMAAVDAVLETQAYAARKGLGLTFGEESVRAIGLSIYISDCKGGAR
jgi:hypothetical protein